MAIEIKKGKQSTPVKAVVYGPEGIGKSTFASQWPAPLFLDLEGGTARLDVARVVCPTAAAVDQAVTEMTTNPQGFRTLVIDTADWLEKALIERVCQAANQTSIEGFGYGKGYTHLAEAWKRFLDSLNAMQAKNGMHVLLLAHAAMRKQELPDEAGAFDRWELKLLKQSPALVKEWADLVLFANYKTLVVEVDGKKKGQGGKRVMYSSHHACWDAKNRFGLPDEMPFEFKAIAAIFATPVVTTAPVPGPNDNPDLMPAASAPVSTPATPPVSGEQPDFDPEQRKLLFQLHDAMKANAVTMPELDAELARKGVVPAGTNPRQYNMATLRRVVGNFDKILHNINLQKQKAA